MYQEMIAENEFLHDIYEDMHVGWGDDLDAAQMIVVKCSLVGMRILGLLFRGSTRMKMMRDLEHF